MTLRLLRLLRLIGVAALLVVSVVEANEEITCQWEGESLNLTESVWIEDPVIVANTKVELREKGYDEQTINQTIERCDWCGYRIVCVAQVELSRTTDNVGDVISQVKGVMVLNRYSRDYYRHILQYKVENN